MWLYALDPLQINGNVIKIIDKPTDIFVQQNLLYLIIRRGTICRRQEMKSQP